MSGALSDKEVEEYIRNEHAELLGVAYFALRAKCEALERERDYERAAAAAERAFADVLAVERDAALTENTRLREALDAAQAELAIWEAHVCEELHLCEDTTSKYFAWLKERKAVLKAALSDAAPSEPDFSGEQLVKPTEETL